ncbi:RNA polymerase sigma factor FliA [Helicobacter canis]|uniref:RNA polymerase sigma factor FliA n=1 Tax=Helicobacter canis TaxID=29419 RepID=A0A5M9QQ63_9HELI|nr:RNA polymerase sigma factor FliA [Helicobacter canis]KAA8709105.1 RNA polymerase sigma factor FliA [Helicobacter canis]
MRNNGYANEKQFSQDQLAIQYLPAVKAMAYRMKERLPSHLEVSELISIGTEELIKLARRYDEGLNDSFWGYAKSRVYGAMLDYLRSLDVISRASRKLIKAIDMEVSKYFNEHEEEPSDEYLSGVLGESVEKIREAKIAADIYMLVPIDEQYNLMEPTNIIDKLEKEELIEKIHNVLKTFSKREQLIIQLYFLEELNLSEIKEILNITESRISQITKEVIKKIRNSLGER